MRNAILPLILAAAIPACSSTSSNQSSTAIGPSTPAIGVKTFDKSGTQAGTFAVTRNGVQQMPTNRATVTEPDGTVRYATPDEEEEVRRTVMKYMIRPPQAE